MLFFSMLFYFYMWGVRFKGSLPQHTVRLQTLSVRARREVQLLRAYTALAKDPSSVPSTHVSQLQLPVTPAPGDLTPSSGLQEHHTNLYNHTHTHTHTHNHMHTITCTIIYA